MSFPQLAPNLELQLENMETTREIQFKEVGRSFVFDFTTNSFIFANGRNIETDKLKAIEQWIELCLRTHKDKFKIYENENFGCNIEDLIGRKVDLFVKAEISREVKESLLNSVQILDVFDINVTQNRGMITIDVSVELRDKTIIKVVV